MKNSQEIVTPTSGSLIVAEQPVKVLLVDDRPDKLIALESILAGPALEIVLAHSGKEALRLVLAHEFAVILLDVSMPIMDGLETASLIRQRKSSEHTPIIFITAYSDSEMPAARGYSLGAVDYIFAPVVPDILRAKVSVFIDLFRKSQEIQRLSELQRKQAERRASSLEIRLDDLLNRLNVGVFSATGDGVLISANPAFFRLFGINPAIDPQPFNLASLYPQAADHAQIVARLESAGQVQDYHVRQCHLDGTLIWVSLSQVLVTDATGHRHIDGLMEDITDRKLAEVALLAKMDELARSNAELEEFAYVASHDLQEPLRMVSAYSSLLASRYAQYLDEKGQSYLGNIVGGTNRMHDLIRDILAFAKTGKQQSYSLINCNEVIEKALFNLNDVIFNSGAKITRDQLPSLIGERVLLGQVFQNLISNAIKFRHKDRPVTVHISVERSGAFWSFAVTDNGIGILPQFYDKIFGVFQRLHSSNKYAGTGIGLAICRNAIQKLGGTISVQAAPGGGSVFTFLLPCSESDHPLLAKSASGLPQPTDLP